ncbi:hypothetical protein BCR33DRAFT_223091 [Rhizoclosmatium globosum]|uniref:Uncharacterized protein n=1 Tax=Rhizoclosmatium globosum TaxID=329046 RepID=A0A1Y2CC47_9FUNG|nr:hypothetical protein BCR33DRAFT_223091 [Rhizoclosmatium globosum]|eukprot:ORY44467.1 hypothetical protein BCR33DRAFT_223091 [Rhizoclosmatium globosum]
MELESKRGSPSNVNRTPTKVVSSSPTVPLVKLGLPVKPFSVPAKDSSPANIFSVPAGTSSQTSLLKPNSTATQPPVIAAPFYPSPTLAANSIPIKIAPPKKSQRERKRETTTPTSSVSTATEKVAWNIPQKRMLALTHLRVGKTARIFGELHLFLPLPVQESGESFLRLQPQ